MIRVTNLVQYQDQRNCLTDIETDSDMNDSFFEDFPHVDYGFDDENQTMGRNVKTQNQRQGRKLSVGKQRRSSANSNYYDSSRTEATTLLEDASSPAGSSSGVSFAGSVEPIKTRLSRHEKNAFIQGQKSGTFECNDSFGSFEDGAFDLASKTKFSSKVSPNGTSKRNHMTRRYSSGSLSSRNSLRAVEEKVKVPVAGCSPPKNTLPLPRSDATAPTVVSDFTDDMSIDVNTIFEKKKVKKLSPVRESQMKKKKSSKSLRSSDDTTSSKKTRKQSGQNSVGSADEILARFAAKMDQMEREAYELDEEFSDSKLLMQGGSMPDPYGRRHSSPPLMHKQFSMSNISAATSAMSSLSCDQHENFLSCEKSSTLKPRRPSLHAVFDWSKEPSIRNINTSDDPPSGAESLVVNMSSMLVVPRRKSLRRSNSSGDIQQYNNTPLWPPRRHQSMTGKLHSQFYRRETKLDTSNCGNRAMDLTPVQTPQQLLKVMEPISMREFLEFNGLQKGDSVESRKNVNYGAILDTESMTSGAGSSVANKK